MVGVSRVEGTVGCTAVVSRTGTGSSGFSCLGVSGTGAESSREGSSTGMLEDWGGGFLRRRLGPLEVKVPSENEYHGS